MGKHNIEKYSIGYAALKLVGKAYYNALYSEVYVFNRPPRFNVPHIFACNHQNALMDALAVLYSVDHAIVFLARSDIFQNPKVAELLYFLKILPVFRMRDGFDSLKNNDEIFQHTIRVLKSCHSVGIYPEGSHAGFKRLRPLQKGVGRIAFQTLEDDRVEKCFFIVPTGIDYEHYQKFGTRIVVSFGQPFDVSSYLPLYRQDPAKALNIVKEKISQEMKKQMVDISSERWYHTISDVVNWIWVYGRLMRFRPSQTYQMSVDLSHKLSDYPDDSVFMLQMEETCNALRLTLDKHHLKPYELDVKKEILKNFFAAITTGIFSLIGLPAFLLFGWFHLLIKRVANKRIKDPQFRTSVRLGVTTVVYIVFTFLFNAWILFYYPWYWYPLAILLTGISGIVGLKMFSRFILFLNRLRSSVLHCFGNKEIDKALILRDNLFAKIESLIQ